ncbi:MAG TPA: HAD family hydrolase [Ktedonobacteraceae bacterium]|nr:HAD family hydrolase [Ktedonobacteraceae bacterium]
MTHVIPPLLAGRTVRCILFDLGGTVWYRNKCAWPQLEACANRHAGALLRQAFSPGSLSCSDDETLGHWLRKALNEQFRQQVHNAPDLEPDGPQALQQALLRCNIDVDRRLSNALFEALRIPVDPSRIPFDDTLPTLATLQDRGFQLGVVTNRLWGGKPFIEGMQDLGMLKYFDPQKMAISADLLLRKPAPEIYQYALRAHGIPAEEAIMVGDSLPADVVGPQHLGMLTVWKPKAMVAQMVKEHLAKHGICLERYNAEHATPCEVRKDELPAEPLPQGMFDTTLADILNHSDYWHQFLLGHIRPDFIIQDLQDLLDIFLVAGRQL